MKFSFLSAIIALATFVQQESIYDLDVQPIHGGSPTSLSAFVGKKIIITPISAINPDTARLAFLESLQRSNAEFQVIAVPAADFGGAGNDQTIAALKEGLSLSFMIAQIAMVTKNSATDQLPLFKWLTDVTKNGHFDIDVNAPGQYFIVNGRGTFYSVLSADVPVHILISALNQEITQ